MVYDPSSITGVISRWRAADLGLSDGTAVTSWTDSKGGLVVTQATTSKKPIYRASVAALGNKPALQFSTASGQCLAVTTGTEMGGSYLASASTGMVFAAIVPSGTQSSTQAWFIASTGTSLQMGRLGIYHDTSNHLGCHGRRLDTDSSATFYANTASSTNGTTATAVTVQGDWSTANATVWLNGAQDRTGAWLTAGTTSATGSDNVSIGFTGGGYYANGWVAEVIVTNVKLSATDRAKIHSYFQDTYGIAVADYTPDGGGGTVAWSYYVTQG